jgi:hypothetical protein
MQELNIADKLLPCRVRAAASEIASVGLGIPTPRFQVGKTLAAADIG